MGEFHRIVLASASPRREELLKLICPEFEIVPSKFDESDVPNGLPPAEHVIVSAERKAQDIAEGMSGAIVDQITDRYYAHFLAHVERGLPLYPDVKETMPRLADRAISTMTTRRREGAKRMLEAAGIASYFRAIVGGDEVSRPKPFPDLPQYSARALGVTPEACVVVGDAPVDILAGRAARAWTVAVTYGYGSPSALREAKPHATIESFRELPDAIGEIESRVRGR